MDTHIYHETRWSDGRSGQIRGGGWAHEAYDALSEAIIKIKEFRKADKVNGWVVHKEMMSLMRTKKGIKGNGPSKKRKRKGAKVAERIYNPVAEESDVECSSEEDD